MDSPIQSSASAASARVSKAASAASKRVSSWVPNALRMAGAGAQIAVLRDGSRKAAKTVRRHPIASALTLAVAAGAGVALWLLRSRSNRRGLDEGMRASELKSERAARRNGEAGASKPATRRVARKAASAKTPTAH